MPINELKKEAEELFEKKDFRRLKWVCIKMLEEDQNHETALTYQAYAYWSRADSEQTLRIAEKIRKLYPENCHPYNLYAMEYLDRGKFEDALECCSRGLEIKDYYWLRINRIEALISLGQIEEAEKFFKASELQGYTFEKALINCGKLSEISGYGNMSESEVLDYLFERKEYIWNEGQNRKYLEGKLKENGDDEIALTYKALWHFELNEYDDLFRTCEKIHRLYPKNYHSYSLEATSYINTNEFEKALESCEKGLEIRAYRQLKVCKTEALICLGKTDDAFEFYMTSKIPDYDFAKALIRCEKYCEISNYDEGLTDSELVEHFLNKCRHIVNSPSKDFKGKFERAVEVCDEILKIDPENEVALGYKVYSLRYLGRYDELLNCADYAIRLYPKNFRFHFLKAELLLEELNDLDGAIENYEKAQSHDVNDDIGPYFLIMALNLKIRELTRLGNYADAIGCYEKILSYPQCNKERLDALFSLERLVKKHGLDYEPSENYRKTLELNRKVYDCLTNDVGDYDANYISGCRKFKDYDSFADYLRDVIVCMIKLCPKHDENAIRETLKNKLAALEFEFNNKTPSYDHAREYVDGYIEMKNLENAYRQGR